MVAATTSSGSAAASSGRKADQDEKLTPVEAAAEKMMGADGEEGAHVEDEGEGEEAVGFEGWARVFFQARNDRSAQQILPTNSSTLARESHLFVVVDPQATELRLYPDDKDLRLIVDPPIELKYFYAVSVPGSEAGAALFLKEDDRQLRRYIFRFEFRNDSVLQPSSRPQSLSLSARVAKYAQRSSNLKQVEIKAKAFSNTKALSLTQLLFTFPKLGLPILFFFIPDFFVGGYAGWITLIVTGLLGVVLRKLVLNHIAKIYRNRKYKTIEAFSKN